MAFYVVLAPPAPTPGVRPDPVDYVFVKDGFCWPCLFIAIPWMLFRRLWLVLIVYLAVVGVMTAIGRTWDWPPAGLFLMLAAVYFALEANGLRVWTLRRRGYDLVGVAAGRDVGEAEIRFFSELQAARVDPRMPPPGRLESVLRLGPPRAPSAETGEVVGLFPAAPGGSGS